MKTYLLINIAIVIIPLALSFDKKVKFYTKWKYVFPAIVFPAIVFIAWDIFFTDIGIWGFNPAHLTGIQIINLPIEEILFFITVPYASIFTYETLKKYFPNINPQITSKYLSLTLSIFLFVVAILNLDKWYTAVTFISTAIVLMLLQFIVKIKIMGRFYIAFCLISLPFLLFDGLLTGSIISSAVVWYNDNENLGFRLGTIPIEDIFYGMLLLLLNVSLFEWFRKKLHEVSEVN